MAGIAAVVLLAVQFGALAGRRPEAVELMARAVADHRAQGERIGPYRVFVRNLVFYSAAASRRISSTRPRPSAFSNRRIACCSSSGRAT